MNALNDLRYNFRATQGRRAVKSVISKMFDMLQATAKTMALPP